MEENSPRRKISGGESGSAKEAEIASPKKVKSLVGTFMSSQQDRRVANAMRSVHLLAALDFIHKSKVSDKERAKLLKILKPDESIIKCARIAREHIRNRCDSDKRGRLKGGAEYNAIEKHLIESLKLEMPTHDYRVLESAYWAQKKEDGEDFWKNISLLTLKLDVTKNRAIVRKPWNAAPVKGGRIIQNDAQLKEWHLVRKYGSDLKLSKKGESINEPSLNITSKRFTHTYERIICFKCNLIISNGGWKGREKFFGDIELCSACKGKMMPDVDIFETRGVLVDGSPNL